MHTKSCVRLQKITEVLPFHTHHSAAAHLHLAPELCEHGGDDHVLLYILDLFFRRPHVLQENLLTFSVYTYNSSTVKCVF